MTAVIAVDLGTTGVKAGVWSEDGRLLAEAYRRRGVRQGADGFALQNAEESWELQRQAVAEAARAIPEPIGALVLTHQRGTFAPADATGRPLGDYIVWMDRRGAPICDR
ncbi:MAG: glycerol kinase, partial [Thermomicrobiales bacterium]|nr:glycerol kinase [Thermomicrobiales bacterium]